MSRHISPSPQRRSRAMVGVVFTALLLAGCSSSHEDPTMSHTEARDELDAALSAAQNAIGGEWEFADSGAEACALPSGDTGARYVLARFGQGVPADQLQPVVDTVVAAWTDATFIPTVTERMQGDIPYTVIGYPESGKTVDGLFVDLDIFASQSSLVGQTRCVPGNSAEINRERRENSSSPTPLP